MEIKVKDLVYSNKVNRLGFVVFIDEEKQIYDLQHNYEYIPSLSQEENINSILCEQSTAERSELVKVNFDIKKAAEKAIGLLLNIKEHIDYLPDEYYNWINEVIHYYECSQD